MGSKDKKLIGKGVKGNPFSEEERKRRDRESKRKWANNNRDKLRENQRRYNEKIRNIVAKYREIEKVESEHS